MATAPGAAGIAMGNVGSLLERQDFSPEELRAALAGSRASRQPDGLFRKGVGQRELFSYLHLPKKDSKTTKKAPRNEPADYATLYYQEHPRAGDFSKTSLPERGRFDKREIQGGYMDMYRRNQALEQELQALREPLAPWSPRLESSKI
ncbi:hypothetical protein E2I00_014156 [Balaenoptera physalus]|uniref:Uncharacterized protein n=1 Tax=Balaenoptera physalus TaxID=9770 RepID=A0A643BNJ1_BALPH|nr:hypothetical protein E2I00_014156 [Balaenoptera physalus]